MQTKLATRITVGVLLLLLGLTTVIIPLLGIDYFIIQPTFQHLEEKQAVEDANRVKSAIENEIDNVGNLAIDWALWDDTYIFAKDHNLHYLESNYPDPSLLSQNSNVDLFAIFDQRRQPLVQGTYHPDIKQLIELDIISGSKPTILTFLAPVFQNEKSISGLLSTNRGMIILSAHQILNSQGQGPSRGVLVMGRFLTQEQLDVIAERVQVQFELLIHDGGRLTASEQDVFSSLGFSALALPHEFRQGTLYQLYHDIENKPVMLIRSQSRGEISAVGKQTRILLNTVLLGLAFVLLTFLVIYHDRIKISEASLQDSENRYRTIFENDYTVMLLIDWTTGAIVDANPAACAYYGWSHEELKGMKIGEINMLSHDKVIAAMEVARSRKENRFIFKHRKSDDTISDVEVFSVPLTIKGKVLLFSIVHDISERKQAEKAQLDLERQIQQVQKVESLGRMAGAIAHHYNNLLGAVMGNLEMAMEDLPGSADSGGWLSAAMTATKRASKIGKLMLAYLGQTGARKEPLDLADICHKSLPDLRAGMPEHIDIWPVLHTPGSVVYANAEQIKLIVENLVNNACEAMNDQPGVISMIVRIISPGGIPEAHRFPIGFQLGTVDYACLEVKDEGSGIAETDIEKIFDPFFSTRFAGRGLGLPVVLGLVKAHGGCVTVESEPGMGSIFRVFLPLSAESVLQRKTQEPERSITLEGATVLVVEDEPMVCNSTVGMLTKMGMTVLTARDGIEAVEVFRQNMSEICCVLCDLTMPRMDGWETLAALRLIEPGIPFILISGYDQAQVMAGDHPEWPQVFLGKPYDRKKLKNALIKAIA